MEISMKEMLVLIPGFANNELVWKHQTDHLRDLFDVRVMVMDKYATRKEMVESLLKKSPARFILAGHSMGGWVAQAAAAAAPERITKLVLLNTWATADPKMIYLQRQVAEALRQGHLKEIMQQHISLLIHPSRQHDTALIQSMQSMIASFPLEVLIRQIDAMLEDYSSLHLHHAICAETLVVHSHDDALFPAKELQAIATGIRNSELAIIEGAGHASTMEKPETVTALIRSFIESKP